MKPRKAEDRKFDSVFDRNTRSLSSRPHDIKTRECLYCRRKIRSGLDRGRGGPATLAFLIKLSSWNIGNTLYCWRKLWTPAGKFVAMLLRDTPGYSYHSGTHKAFNKVLCDTKKLLLDFCEYVWKSVKSMKIE